MTREEAFDILTGLVQAIREMEYQGIIHETLSLSISIRTCEAFEIACKALKKEIEEAKL